MFNKKLSVVAASLLYSISMGQAYARDGGHGNNPANTVTVAPNWYDCRGGHNTHLVVRIGSNAEASITIPGPTTMELDWRGENYYSEGEGITSDATAMGAVMSMPMDFTPDVSITKASVIVPEIYFGQNIKEARFRSQLVITTIATPLTATPVEGVVNPSKYYDLNCVASMVNY
jgi:hypothetical protein